MKNLMRRASRGDPKRAQTESMNRPKSVRILNIAETVTDNRARCMPEG